MPARITERRIPFYFQASDLGQHVDASDGKAVLISFLSSPVVANQLQQYVVFVTDDTLATDVTTFNWRIQNGATDESSSIDKGYWSITPQHEGSLTITVELKNAAEQIISSIELTQVVTASNSELEALIDQQDVMAPFAGHPPTSREVINNYRAYIELLQAVDSDTDNSLNRLVFAIAYVESQKTTSKKRAKVSESIAAGLNQTDNSALLSNAEQGLGLCQIRPHIFGMYFSSTEAGTDMLIERQELPTESKKRPAVIDNLKESLSELSENNKIDLFNVLRFPKINLRLCKLFLVRLKDQYYAVESFENLFSDKPKITDLIDQYKQGPIEVEDPE